MVGCRELWVGRMTPAASRRASGRAMPADDALRAGDFTEKLICSGPSRGCFSATAGLQKGENRGRRT